MQKAQAYYDRGEYDSCERVIDHILSYPSGQLNRESVFKLLSENSQKQREQLLLIKRADEVAKSSSRMSGVKLRTTKGLLAQQAYNFNHQSRGYPSENGIYTSLYLALKEFGDPAGQTYQVYDTPGDIYLLQGKNNDIFYTIHQSGSLITWKRSDVGFSYQEYSGYWRNVTVKTVKLSPDGNSIFMGGRINSQAFAEIIDIRDLTRKLSLKNLGESITDAAYRNDNEIYILDDYGSTISHYSDRINTKLMSTPVKFSAIECDGQGKYLYAAGTDGKLYSYDLGKGMREQVLLEVNTRVTALQADQTDSLLAAGDSEGFVYLMDGTETRIFAGHTGTVQEIVFSKDLRFMASAGADRKILIWDLQNQKKGPLELSDNNDRITSIIFSNDQKNLLTGTFNRAVKSWPLQMDVMGSKLCDYLDRNLSKAEWSRYIGDDIAYQNTCFDINMNKSPE